MVKHSNSELEIVSTFNAPVGSYKGLLVSRLGPLHALERHTLKLALHRSPLGWQSIFRTETPIGDRQSSMPCVLDE